MAVAPALYAAVCGSCATGAEVGAAAAAADVATAGGAVCTGAGAEVAVTGGAVATAAALVTDAALVAAALAWPAVGVELPPPPDESQLLAPSSTGATAAASRVIVQRLTPRPSTKQFGPPSLSRTERLTPPPPVCRCAL
jgi:hypothetical protein